MQQGDYGNQGSEPWANRRTAIPRKTWTGKIVYPKSPSHRKGFRIEDVERILAKIVPPENSDSETWSAKIVAILRASTLQMLDKILWFLPGSIVEDAYEWGIGILDTIFKVESVPDNVRKITAKRIIVYVADRAGLSVTISS